MKQLTYLVVISSLKRHGGWKSSSVAEGYVEESMTNKKQTAVRILAPTDNIDLSDTSTEMTCNIPVTFGSNQALLLLCIQNGCMGIPVDSEKVVQYIYSYHGYIDTRSSACDERFGRWSITGNLTAQNKGKRWIFQLSNLKTSLFNGPKADLNLSHEEDIPKEAEFLYQPFEYDNDKYIFVYPNEPLWSFNLKRGIASNFHSLNETVERDHFEMSVFGNCETNYDFTDKQNVVKTINSCTDIKYKLKTNVLSAARPNEFELLQRETVVHIKPDNVDGDQLFRSIHSVSKIKFQPMPKSPNSQHVDQHLELDLLSSTSNFEYIILNETEKRSIIFEYADDPFQGAHKYETDSKELVKIFLDNYDKFETLLDQTPVENHRNTTEDPIENMFLAMYDMRDEDGFKMLREKVENKENWDMFSIFFGLLPYIGTNGSVKYINDIILKGDLDTMRFYSIRFLATFPGYINNPTNELLQSFEEILNVENIQSDIIRSGRILSFASIVARSIQQGFISEENIQKYQKMYHEKYLGSQDYEQKMMYLLGLVNMAEGLSVDFITSIITNTSDSANLRSMALAGFKSKLLIDSNADKIFNMFWPIVQDTKENFEVRVASLDLLMSTELNDEQFNKLLGHYKMYRNDNIYSKHLANYFLTTIESYQNTTGYLDPIGNLSTAALKNEHFPVIARPWMTGNYRLSYTDDSPNLGEYIQAQLIANPALNTISTAQFTYNHFVLAYDTKSSIYLKLQGGIEHMFKKQLFKHITEDMTIPELLKIIKESQFKLKNRHQDFHIEIVVFVDNKVVFATSLDNENFQQKFKYLIEIVDDMSFNLLTISFPVMDYFQTPSVLGTPINIMNDMQQIYKYNFRGNDLLYRSSWTFQSWLESYNPILDTTVSSYKYYGDEKGLKTRASFSFENLGVAWMTKQDSFSWAWDKLIGTSVDDEDMLKRFCPDCEAMHEIPTDLYQYERIKDLSKWGLELNTTFETNEENLNFGIEDMFGAFLETHYSNAYAIPHAKLLLPFIHYFKDEFYLKSELQRGFYRSIPLIEDGVQTLIKCDWSNNPVDPFKDTYNNYSVRVINKVIFDENSEEILSIWTYLYQTMSTHNHTDEHGNNKVKLTQNINYYLFKKNSTGVRLCGSRNELLPAVRSDKFSLLPIENTTATTIILKDNLFLDETDWTSCSDNHTITLTETFSTFESRNKKVQESSEYKQCKTESKGLRFTPPTRSCIKSFVDGSQYDQYLVNAAINNVNNIDGTDFDDHYLFKASHLDENTIILSMLKTPFFDLDKDISKYASYSSYYPYMTRNPTSEVYGDNDLLMGFKRSCIITPNNIRSFTGHNTPTDQNKQVAFVECTENAMRGLTTQKLSNTQIVFIFWSKNNKVEAKIEDNKMRIIINGEELKESLSDTYDMQISVHFLDENVVFISDGRISIYYNTEYILVKASSIYNDVICGACSEV